MKTLLPIIANGLVILGLLVLFSSLSQIRKLIKQLGTSPIRQKWFIQCGLVFFFIFGYLGYTVAFWGTYSEWIQTIVPGVFFFGAVFVWITTSLSLQTAIDIRRVALLEHENIMDPLIGIYNRRYMDRRLKEEFDRAKRYQHDLALLMIDIDHFKRVNDKYGHIVGDMVLRYCGGLVLEKVRTTDIVTRYGGEEILIIAPMTSSVGAVSLAERVRSSIHIHEFVLSNENNQQIEIKITVSIGVSYLNARVKDVDSLIKEADKAMYQAKSNGRNRVVVGN
ncbi:MAG: GGDEF domain-containing protein [Anaerolinea sp.]|nr:GGDEF domain-containing protein [Anaerolinea sp.]